MPAQFMMSRLPGLQAANHKVQVVEYFVEALLGNYATDAETEAFVDEYDFYFFPVVNPDGAS